MKGRLFFVKKAVSRGILGFPIGTAIGTSITIVLSFLLGDGYYSPVAPEMTDMCGSEISAVALQFVLCGIMGAVFAAMSVIWENDKLNLAAQSAINFALSVCTIIPTAYLCFWMEHSLSGILSYISVFAGIYASIWVVMYFGYRANLMKINKKIQG